MVQRGLILAAMLLACLCLGSVSNAADADMKEVMARLKALEDKNKDLEGKLKTAEAKAENRASVNSAVDRAMAAAAVKLSSVVTAEDCCQRPLKIGGYLDFSYQYNLTKPDSGHNHNRVFDNDSNGFNLHLAEINFERLPTKAGEAGFRIDLALGTDQRVFASQDYASDPSQRFQQFKDIDLQQAYIEYIAPIGKGITIDAGKFVTWSGAEVIEASDNMNASRSILFGFAIPFTHTGFRATYEALSGDKDGIGKWTVGAGLVNGWDNIQDQNDAKTWMAMSNWQATKWFNWVVVATYGDEQAVDERALLRGQLAGPTLTNPDGGAFAGSDLDDATIPGLGSTLTGRNWDSHNTGARTLIDTTMTFTPWDKLTFVLNGDYGSENRVPQANGPRNRTWWGAAGYVKYQFLKNWYIAGRAEYFNDDDGVRTGLRQCLWEGTLTADWALSDPLHVRFEYRHDESNRNSFSDTKGVGNGGVNFARALRSDKQDTLMMQWLYRF